LASIPELHKGLKIPALDLHGNAKAEGMLATAEWLAAEQQIY
jgi:hypothetical protein